MDWRSTIATPCPGTIANKKVVAKNAGIFEIKEPTELTYLLRFL
jgi:hypothetical protein